jgi:DNA-damage-inducible protein J
MSATNVQVRMDPELKSATEAVLKSMGLTMTVAITMFCQQVVNQRRIPFEIVAPRMDTKEGWEKFNFNEE